MASLALLIAGLGGVSAAQAGLGPIHVLSADGEAFSAEIPVVNEDIEDFAQADLADRNHYPLLSAYSGSAAVLQFNLVRGGDGHIQKVLVKGPASFSEPLLRFAVEVRWPDGRLVREFEVDYKRDGPRRKEPAPVGGDDGKRHVASSDQGSRLDGAGLGELKVSSRLGEPLQAELNLLGAVFDKTDQVQVAIFADASQGGAVPEQLQQVASIMHKLDRAADGRHVLQLASTLPITVPRLAFRVEVRAAGIKVQKDYALMLESAPPSQAKTDAAAHPAGQPPAAKQEAVRTYMVRKGDSLSVIAARVRGHESGENVAGRLLKDNPDAFIDGDANRLLAGAALHYPEQWKLRSEPARHHAMEKAAAADDASKLAAKPGAMAKLLADARPAASAKAEAAKPAPTPAASKPQASSPAALVAERRMHDMLVMQDKALKQTEARAKALEEQIRNVQQHKKKTPEPQSAPTARASKPVPVTPPKPAAPAMAASAAKDRIAAPAAKLDELDTYPIEVKAVVSSAPRPAAPAMAAQNKPVPKAAESSMMDDALSALGDRDIQLRLGGAAAALALVALLLMRRKRSRQDGGAAPMSDDAARQKAASMLTLGPLTSLMSSLKKGDGIDLGSVDVMAEAEVYLAYGRDDQALLILREGMVKEPMRQDLRYKLLEVLAAQPNKEEFVKEASVTHGMFSKDSTFWMRVCELGRAAVPGNPLFETAATPQTVVMPAVGSMQPVAAARVPDPDPEADPRVSLRVELGTPPPVVPETRTVLEAPPPLAEQSAPQAEEVDREKLELAKLYMEMGDKETAEILMREAQQGR
ncbi:hypothetical protein [Chromobacterium sphagni]|uniref:FimV N-terminal domain-containing protein n=1 Tax=Chromobacterium sphagni TaxID=1903179 RepID=A0ABX3CBF0_9NEIS|nr:hypothetical protein [Chromobacterium sphagni]OHX19616.1 hypothetical protein BI344_17685 [Chromobacterium sphagni]